MGDTADNIPGIPGVGEKTATKIIAAYGSIENAHEHLEEIKPNKAKESLRDHYDLAVLSKKLATIDTESPVEFSWEAARMGNLYTPEAYDYFKRLEFKNLLSRFDQQETEQKELPSWAERRRFCRGGKYLEPGRTVRTDRRGCRGRDGRNPRCRGGDGKSGSGVFPGGRLPDRRCVMRSSGAAFLRAVPRLEPGM